MNQHVECPICNRTATTCASTTGTLEYFCSFCGDFQMSCSLARGFSEFIKNHVDGRAKLSHQARMAKEAGEIFNFTSLSAEIVLKQSLPQPQKQADLLVRYLAENCSGPGQAVSLDFDSQGAVIGAKSQDGFEFVLSHLVETKLINTKPINGSKKGVNFSNPNL